LPVIQVETGETITIGELGSVYSDEWMRLMTGSSG